MGRVTKNARARARMCERLIELIDVAYRKTDAEMARVLGYANTSTLYRVRRGAVFPDVERLWRLLEHAPARGVAVNLNWVVAGIGKPLLRTSGDVIQGEMTLGEFIDRRWRR